MKKKIAVILVLGLIVSLFGSNKISQAATHTCDSTCFKQAIHKHDGSITTGGSCYSNVMSNILCGIVTVDLSLTSNNQASVGMWVTFYGICSGCGEKIKAGDFSTGPNGTNGIYMNDGDTIDHIVYGYALTCNASTSNLSYDAKSHTHTGSPNSYGGCYRGAYSSSGVCNGIMTGYTINNSNCHYCGAVIQNVLWTCTGCGNGVPMYKYTASQGYSGCHANEQHYLKGIEWDEIDGNLIHIGQKVGYGISCGKISGEWYNSDGTAAIKICNKKVTSISSKTKNQTIVR